MPQVLNVAIRHEQPGDETAIARVNDEAFGQPDEARLIDALRRAGCCVVSLVAVETSTIVGHILFTPVTIEPHGPALRALGLGPMAVLPRLQRHGIGSQLVQAGLRACADVGCQVVVVIGHPDFYPRFGFEPASRFNLKSTFEVPDEAFMVRELTSGTLAQRGGLVRYAPEFDS